MSNTIRDLELQISKMHEALAIKERADARARLRDEFAGRALSWVLTAEVHYPTAAKACYEIADAMLEARNANR